MELVWDDMRDGPQPVVELTGQNIKINSQLMKRSGGRDNLLLNFYS